MLGVRRLPPKSGFAATNLEPWVDQLIPPDPFPVTGDFDSLVITSTLHNYCKCIALKQSPSDRNRS